MAAPLPALPAQKVFKPKHNLDILGNYEVPAPASYWERFPSNFKKPALSLLDGRKLQQLALDAGFKNRALLKKITRDLVEGADIGCRGRYRQPGRARNAPSAAKNGVRVSDAIADWIHKGFAFGPVPLHEVPHEAKFNGIMAREKPNGSVRIILNLSSPKGSAVNEGIDNKNFPAKMSSTSKWVGALWKAGRNCKILKIDWADAYKHIAVRPADIDLQWFQWCGMAFQELCLIFGGVSSAGIFDRTAKLVLFIVIARSGINPALVCQHLDDCCAAGPAGSTVLEQFDAEYFAVAEELGLKLASRDDPDKSFGPSRQGTVLGVVYDTVAWTWAIPQDKLIRLLHDLQNVLDTEDGIPQERIWSIAGKILHVKALVPEGKFNLYHLLVANSVTTDGWEVIPVSRDLKRQLWFWQTMLPVCSEATTIPRLDEPLPPWAVDIYTDAAGGSRRSKLRGVGAVTSAWWVYLAWGAAINSGRQTDNGKRLDRVMSALELVGPLLALCAAAKFCRNGMVRFWVDNSGSVCIYNKGYSTSCPLSSALVCAISAVAAGLGCRVEVVKITRCSTPLADMADALSKAAFERFRGLARQNNLDLPREPLVVPKALRSWVQNPTPDFELGQKILRELARTGPVLGY